MKILFEIKKVTKPNYLPKLKQGVEIFELGGGKIYIGNIKRGIQLENIPISLPRAFNGRKSLKYIIENTVVDQELVEDLVDLLVKQELLDIYPTKLIFEDRFQSQITGRPSNSGLFENDVAVRDFEHRINAESALTTWRKGVIEGGKVLLSKRQEIQLKLMGDEESCIALYLSLIASGFTGTYLDINRELQMDDLRAGFFNLNDVGSNLKSTLEAIVKERQLFKNGDQHENKAVLIIYFGKPTDKEIQSWLSEEVPHLIIESIGPNLVVGPLVLPGDSPCLNCVSKVDTKILKGIKEISAFQRPAIGALNWIIGYLNLAIAEFVDTGSSPLIGSAKVFDVVNPNEIREIKYPRHPSCGCNWLK